MTLSPDKFLIISAVLFTLGVLGVLMRRCAISILMSVELMLNAAQSAVHHLRPQFGEADGQIYVFFIITLAAAEAAVGLAIVIALFRLRESTDVDELHLLKW